MGSARLTHGKRTASAGPVSTGVCAVRNPSDKAGLVRLDIAQRLWGWGNLSPLDDVFGSMAIIRLALNRTSKFGLIACRLADRLQRYSKEAGLWIDAFESEQRDPGLHKEKDIKCTFQSWAEDEALLGAGKFTDIAAFEPGPISPLPIICRQCANGLRSGGRLFLVDLMTSDVSVAQSTSARRMYPASECESQLCNTGLQLQARVDLTPDTLNKIRLGLVAAADMLIEARKLDLPERKLMRFVLASQVETWGRIGGLLSAGKMTATAFLAVKP